MLVVRQTFQAKYGRGPIGCSLKRVQQAYAGGK